MVEAKVVLKDGRTGTVYAVDYDSLFKRLEGVEIAAIETRVIKITDMRQGAEFFRNNERG